VRAINRPKALCPACRAVCDADVNRVRNSYVCSRSLDGPVVKPTRFFSATALNRINILPSLGAKLCQPLIYVSLSATKLLLKFFINHVNNRELAAKAVENYGFIKSKFVTLAAVPNISSSVIHLFIFSPKLSLSFRYRPI